MDRQTEQQWHERVSLFAFRPDNAVQHAGLIFPHTTHWLGVCCADEREQPCKLGTLCNFFRKALRYTWSFAPMPSIDETVVIGFASVSALIAWATQSVPARVERATWNWAHVASTAFPNWRANVLATSQRNEVPVAMLGTPPSGFCKAVMVAAMNAFLTELWHVSLAVSSAALNKSWNNSWSKHTLNVSFVHPPGPDALRRCTANTS